MSEPRTMDSDEDIGVAGDPQLIFERDLLSEDHSLNCIARVRRYPLNQIFFVQNFPVFGAARQESDSECRIRAGFDLLDLKSVKDVLGESVEQGAVLTTENLKRKRFEY